MVKKQYFTTSISYQKKQLPIFTIVKNGILFNGIILFIFFTTAGFSQGASFRVAINANVFTSGDTLEITAKYSLAEKNYH